MSSLKLQKTEFLVLFICLFVSLFCVYACAFRSREQAKQVICASNIRLNCQSIISYAGDHDGDVTFDTAGWWPCDISYSATNDLMQYGSTRQGFYCPSNKGANAFDIRRWQFALLSMNPSQNVYTDFDESVLTLSQKQQYFRMITYYILTENPSVPVGPFLGTPARDWISNLEDITNPQEYEMVVDQTVSEMYSSSFYNISSGGLATYALYEQTNHLNKSGMPLGGNIGFVDGHVAWRPFEQMQIRCQTGLAFWW